MSATNCPRLARVFSGIQPTGIPHLGNYFGALVKWRHLANRRQLRLPKQTSGQTKQSSDQQITDTNLLAIESDHVIHCDKPIFCIVDVHAYSSAHTQLGSPLYDHILSTTASLIAIGLNPKNSILLRQSDLFEHNYLDNVLDNFVSTQRLTHMIQFKEKLASKVDHNMHDWSNLNLGKTMKGVPNGLLNYPVLQAADILLYRSEIVPVGEDQLQHIELTREIARKFNLKTQTNLFPDPRGVLNDSQHARRVKSLRDPYKKMSKSDPNKRAFIEIVDKPDVILDKVKKAITDPISAVYYDAQLRPGVSNLMRIHHLVTGQTFEQIRDQYERVESATYKLNLADILIEYFKPIRLQYERVRNDRSYLEQVLSQGHLEAQPIAQKTIEQVRHLMGSIRID